jgi:hypothetical protein
MPRRSARTPPRIGPAQANGNWESEASPAPSPVPRAPPSTNRLCPAWSPT